MAWIIGVAGSAIIILLTVLIGLVITWSRSQELAHVEAPESVADPVPKDPEPEDPEPEEPKAAPAVEVLDEIPEQKPVEVEPAPNTDEEPTNEVVEPTTVSSEEPSPDPVPEVDPDPKSKPKPKPQQPRILVIFKVPGSPQNAEVKVGSRLLKYNYAATTRLTPGKYSVRWRLKPEDPWHDAGSLVVDDIGSTKHYEVSVSATKVTTTIADGGPK